MEHCWHVVFVGVVVDEADIAVDAVFDVGLWLLLMVINAVSAAALLVTRLMLVFLQLFLCILVLPLMLLSMFLDVSDEAAIAVDAVFDVTAIS